MRVMLRLTNRLADEKSPYLLQHKGNPVAWQPWGEEAFAFAREAGVPVFLSIGYSTCHWCHVMAHESFEDEAIAALMNAEFVNIKVDREERPDVDRVYMTFVQASTGGGGWPMSVWLTPEGRPFFGGTYFPPEDRYGRAGFPRVLEQIARVWKSDRARVEAEGVRVAEMLATSVDVERGEGEISREVIVRAVGAFVEGYDARHGGFGDEPKFPRASVFNLLLRAGNDVARGMVFHTLRAMAGGGMYDQVGGGFHRYSVDAEWHVPHFEKMLYDQAQLIPVYVEAFQIAREPLFATIARETASYVLRDLRHEGGAFFSAEDADSLVAHGGSAHREGAFYVWTQDEIEGALTPDESRLWCRHFGVMPGGNVLPTSDPHGELVGKNVLFRRELVAATASASGVTEADATALLASAKQKLFALREARPRPHRDEKILTAWNGLMISALAKAGAVFDDVALVRHAAGAARFLSENLVSDRGLLRSWCDGPSAIRAFPEDYAFLIQGLLDLFETDFDSWGLEWALTLQSEQDAAFADLANGGYFGSRADDVLVPVRMKDDHDGAEPCANSVSAMNLLRLGELAGDSAFTARARRILGSPIARRIPIALPQLLVAAHRASLPPRQIVIVGDEPRAFVDVVNDHFRPDTTLVVMTSAGREFFERHNPAIAAMRPVNGLTAAYVCENFVCHSPVTDPERLGLCSRIA